MIKEKTTLCETCSHGLIREWESWVHTITNHLNRCLLDNSYVEVVTECNKYSKQVPKVTYHDPEFDEYAEKMEEAG